MPRCLLCPLLSGTMPKTSWFIADSKTPADDDGLMTPQTLCPPSFTLHRPRPLLILRIPKKLKLSRKVSPKGSKICFSRPNYKWVSAMTTGQVLSHITAISCFVSVLGWKKCVSPPIALLRWKPCWFGSLIDTQKKHPLKTKTHATCMTCPPSKSQNKQHMNLAGGFNPSEQYSQLGWLFPILWKIKNVPNHQPVTH